VQDAIELSVTDNGIGLNYSETPRGLGSRIIALLTQQRGGCLHYERIVIGFGSEVGTCSTCYLNHKRDLLSRRP
jgi:two-component sensor histidine kinase